MSKRIHQAALTLALTALTTAHAFAFTLNPISSTQPQLKSTSTSLTSRTGGTIVRPPSGNLTTQSRVSSNFEIQRLMEAYNQAESLQKSDVSKSGNDTANAIIKHLAG